MGTLAEFEHWIVLSYEKTQILKCENVFYCKSKVESNDGYTMMVKKTGSIEGCEVDIIITYNLSGENTAFRSGTLTKNNKEFRINSSFFYTSLQIENWGYDKIQVIRLDKNPYSLLEKG